MLAIRAGQPRPVQLGGTHAAFRSAETIGDVRRRDEERFTLQLSGGLQAGRALMRGNMATPQPAPYIKPRREGHSPRALPPPRQRGGFVFAPSQPAEPALTLRKIGQCLRLLITFRRCLCLAWATNKLTKVITERR